MRRTIAGAFVLTLLASPLWAAEIVIPASKMSARDPRVVPSDGKWDGLAVCHGVGGFEQWAAKVKAPGAYYVHFLYSSGQSRPCTLTINDKKQRGAVLGDSTGGFLAKDLAWRTVGPFDLAKGANRIRLDGARNMPHVGGLVVSSDKMPPKASVFDKWIGRGKGTDTPAGRKPAPARKDVVITDDPAATAETRMALLGHSSPVDKIVFIKRQTYNSNHYYTEYLNSQWRPGGNLCVLSLTDGGVREIVPDLAGGVFGRFDLSFDAKRIVFDYKKGPLDGYRIHEVNVDGTGLRQITFPPDDEQKLIEKYKLSKGYHHGTDDMHPCYLPDGGIAFISTRCQYGILCNASDDFTTTVLYRIDLDGKNMRKLTNSSVSEAAPVAMPDGQILYTRWEYFDKGAVSVKCLWAMRPDGSGSMEIYGNDLSLPPTLIFGRAIPEHPGKYVVCGTPHYPHAGVGTIIRLDMTRDIRTREPMTYMTPQTDIRAEGGFDFREGEGPWERDRSGRGPLFRDPYPLSDKLFLVAHKPAGPGWNDAKAYALYLLDETGGVRPVYRDPEISCWQGMPLRARKRPPVLNSARDVELAAKGQAVCAVMDVYHGLQGVERGEIKYIRVLEQIPRPWGARRSWKGDIYDQQHAVVTKDTHLALKVQHGIVPVEKDGSAHFVVPADRNISLQVLDANYMAVQTERTYVNYMPGERRSCIGCHETPADAKTFVSRGQPLAVSRPPSIPTAQPGEEAARRTLHYPTDVQPVLDKHCVECHGGDEPKAGQDLSGTRTAQFSVSYESLLPERRRGKGRRKFELVGPTIGENHPKTGNVHYLHARSLGSHASILVAMLSKGKVRLQDAEQADIAAKLAAKHKKINLTQEELLKITNWVDTNGQFYGSYWGRRHIQHKDHPNFRPVSTFEEAISTIPPIPEDER